MAVLERLQKIIARAGVASRRHAEQLIRAGHVTVNGAVITEMGSKADPEHDSIKVAGKLLRFPEAQVYLLLNKPARCVSTMSDPEGRRTLRDFVHGAGERVYPVGRLDYHAEGLLLLTNDGELANTMLRARNLRQTYWIKLKGALGRDEHGRIEQRSGARFRVVRPGPNPWYEVVLRGARRDVLRPELAHMGHPVEKMKRVGLAGLELGSLEPGEYRHLAPQELSALRRALLAAPDLSPGKVQRKRKLGRRTG